MLIHLGMSGSLRIVKEGELPGKHDHVDICFEEGHILRFKDPFLDTLLIISQIEIL